MPPSSRLKSMNAERMGVVARRAPESPRMAYSRPSSSHRDVSPHRQRTRSPATPRVVVPPQSPRSTTFSYVSQQYANSNAPAIYSPTTAQFHFRTTKQGPVFADAAPPEFPKHLPLEVYECILIQLQLLHVGGHGEGCLTCYMRDLYSLSLTSRGWERAVRSKL